MYMSVFGIQETFRVCPPRFTLAKYGGGMTKEIWYPLDFAISVEPPLCTFAMFSEACIRKGDINSIQTSTVSTKVQLKNITRPLERSTEPAEPTSNGREPILLKLLGKLNSDNTATKGVESPAKPGKGTSTDVAVPSKKKPKRESTQMLLDCV
jgi:hypothetical protein